MSSSAAIRLDTDNNAILVSEGGTVKCRTDPGGDERVGPCVYAGMTTVLDGILKRLDLELFQYYDETEYIRSAIGLVQQNIFVGGAFTFIVLLLFLHLIYLI